jgi:Flp pilus assembly protein TadG
VNRNERGAVTAELAITLPILLVVTVGLAWLISLGVSQVQATSAARETARQLARGESPTHALGAGKSLAPPAAVVTYVVSGDQVTVSVTAQRSNPKGLWRVVPAVPITATAIAMMEPSS